MTPEVVYETASAERILYKRGNFSVPLDGFHAWLYREMIGIYGKAEATDRFWWIWHKKESPVCNHHEANRATYNDNKEYTTKNEKKGKLS